MHKTTQTASRSFLVAIIVAAIGLLVVFANPRQAIAQPAAAADATAGGVGLALYAEDDGSLSVRGLMPGGPGEKGGLRAGDVLTAIDGQPVTFDLAKQRLRGPVGSTVKVTVSRKGQIISVALMREAMNLPPAGPNVAGPGPVNAGPAVPGGGANGLPDFLRPGFRLSWIGGNSTLAGSHMVPDPQGLIDWKGQKWSLVGSNQSGGAGFSQITILHAHPQLIVADVRTFLLIDIEKGISASKNHTLFVGNGEGLGDYWVNPAKLAQMKEERTQTDTITRGVYALGSRKFKSISIRHQGQDGFSSKTYDIETGLMLFGGTCDIDPTLYISHKDNGQVDQVEGNKTYSHNKLAAVRETKVPWAGGGIPQFLKMGHRLDYTGTVTQTHPGVPGLPALPALPPQATTLSYVVDKELAADCISVSLLARFDLGPGMPANEVKGIRPFASTMFGGLWTPPAALKALQPGQVLDEDPLTHYKVSFGGIQGKLALLNERGPTDLLEMTYDMDSGLLVGSRYTSESQPNVGSMRIQYQLTGKN